MALETVSNIKDLVAANPVNATDDVSEGDDHIRNIKKALLADLPNITGPITATQVEINLLTGIGGDVVSTTDVQTLTNKTLTSPVLTLAQSTTPTPTAEGVIEWDTDGNNLAIGDGAATQTFLSDANRITATETLTNKTINSDNNTITNLGASTIDFTMATGGSWTISGSSQVIPAGIYQVTVTSAGSPTVRIDINQSSTWRNGLQSGTTYHYVGGLIFSDGTNVRITETAGVSTVIYYRQLA